MGYSYTTLHCGAVQWSGGTVTEGRELSEVSTNEFNSL